MIRMQAASGASFKEPLQSTVLEPDNHLQSVPCNVSRVNEIRPWEDATSLKGPASDSEANSLET